MEQWLALWQPGLHLHVLIDEVSRCALFPSLPPLSLPRPELMLASLPNAVLIAIVSFVIGVSVADVFAKKYNYTINPSQVDYTFYVR